MDDEVAVIEVPINNDLERRIADAFDVFDHAGNKMIDVREVGTVIRGLGACPSEAEVQEIILAIENTASPGSVHLVDFLPYVCQLFTEHRYEPASAAQLLEAFHLLDYERRGYVSKEYISTLMTQDGEPFSQDELDEMLEVALDPSTQTIPYEYYINKLMPNPAICNAYFLADEIEAAKPPPPPPPKRFSEMMKDMGGAPDDYSV